MSASRHRSTAGPVYDVLPPAPGAGVRRRPARPANDIADAEFVVLARGHRAGARVRPSFNDNRPAHRVAQRLTDRLSAGFGNLVQRGERVLGDLPDSIFSALTAMIFLAVFFLAGGIAAVARMNDAPRATGLALTHVVSLPREANGLRLLAVTGIVENRGSVDLAPGRLHADLMLDGRLIGRTELTLATGTIPAGESRGFSTKLPHPGGKAPEVRLSFAPEAGRAR